MVCQGEFQEGPGSDHWQLWAVFMEVSQGGQGNGYRLYLIQEQQTEGGVQRSPAADVFQFLKDCLDVVGLEEVRQSRMPFEIDLVQHQSLAFRELPNQGRLAYLSSAPNHQGLSVGRTQPIGQFLLAKSAQFEDPFGKTQAFPGYPNYIIYPYLVPIKHFFGVNFVYLLNIIGVYFVQKAELSGWLRGLQPPGFGSKPTATLFQSRPVGTE